MTENNKIVKKIGRPRMDPAIGTVFGRLTVIGKADSKNGMARSICKCSCGNTTTVYNFSLRNGNTMSCGCLLHDAHLVHGESCRAKGPSRLFKIWCGMKDRCNNVNSKIYKYYGGRGIFVCEEWKAFSVFKEWAIKHEYSNELSIDRIDVNGPYAPNNCRWATKKEQSINRRNNVRIELNGIEKTMVEWCKERKVSYSLVNDRYRRGWRGEMLFSKAKPKIEITINGESKTLAEWSRVSGIDIETLSYRIKRGWPLSDVFSKPDIKRIKHLRLKTKRKES